jgi:hypothetical protein
MRSGTEVTRCALLSEVGYAAVVSRDIFVDALLLSVLRERLNSLALGLPLCHMLSTLAKRWLRKQPIPSGL